MTLEETISKKINKALKKGYVPVPGAEVVTFAVTLQTTSASYVDFQVKTAEEKVMQLLVGLNDIIFDHGFAKALWGEDYKDQLKLLAVQSTVKGRINHIGSSK